MPRTSPGRMVSEPKTAAFLNASEKPSAGTTAVARLTRSLTETTKASPSFCTEPAKICRLLGPTDGRPQDATMAKAVTAAMGRTHRMVWDFTARSPRPVQLCLEIAVFSVFWEIITQRLRKIQRLERVSSVHKAQLLPRGRGATAQRLIRIVCAQHHIDHMAQELPAPL